MKKILLLTFTLLLSINIFAQTSHLYEHDYPVITTENPQIRALMDSVSIDSIKAKIEHLSSYHTRRYDSRFIYDVQDWLYDHYNSLPIATASASPRQAITSWPYNGAPGRRKSS